MIDLVVPRGSNKLVSQIKDATKIPVLGHAVGIASKVPLPNYRLDLDDKRPQREVITWLRLVVIPLSLQRRVEGLLQKYLDRLLLSYATGSLDDLNSANEVKEIDIDENTDSFCE
ncbi:hypothetical protein VNO80_13109 [Phaseolus coccineus]|uniref:Uncharacterized protein n=1 Tax=Phaseolus coccineus TaxID=3886 RepID=A0AAN9RB25_PHACN